MLIVFEGIDGCGKTTVIQRLQAVLTERGYDVIVTSEFCNDLPGTPELRAELMERKSDPLGHGGINLVKAAFRGYAALPNPTADDWRQVLNYHGDSLAKCHHAYLKAIRAAHPDSGGSDKEAARVNAAWERAQEELA